MTRIVVDAATRRKLQSANDVVELCDEAGEVLGHFTPRKFDMSVWEPISPEVSEEELDRRAQSTEPRYTTAEVIAYLEKL